LRRGSRYLRRGAAEQYRRTQRRTFAAGVRVGATTVAAGATAGIILGFFLNSPRPLTNPETMRFHSLTRSAIEQNLEGLGLSAGEYSISHKPGKPEVRLTFLRAEAENEEAAETMRRWLEAKIKVRLVNNQLADPSISSTPNVSSRIIYPNPNSKRIELEFVAESPESRARALMIKAKEAARRWFPPGRK